jgi:mono/diheme cytochrome c family protein
MKTEKASRKALPKFPINQLTLLISTVTCVWMGSFLSGCASRPKEVETDPAVRAQRFPRGSFNSKIEGNARELFNEGREIFRYDTFGSEAFWGDKLQLHRAIARKEKGGLDKGLTPRQALQLGLKADVAKVPRLLFEVLREGAVSFDNPDTTLELLRADAVVGVQGVFDKKNNLKSIGITCAICHSTVDDSFMKGIGRRLDGWPNRDLNVGAIVATAPNLKPLADLLKISEEEVRKVLMSWGPGKYDAELNQDGKGFRPDGKTAATLIPAAFGLAGQNLHTYAGWGSVPYWNAYVANTQMYGQGTFFDPRLANTNQFPVTARSGFANKRDVPDLITSKLPALHYYQLSIPPPRPPKGSFDRKGAERGSAVFRNQARCATCHVPPLFSEPGWAMHRGEEIGIDNFQSDRSPDKRYRTTPLLGLSARTKGGFYHDGRFATLNDVIEHYNKHFSLQLTPEHKADLLEYLKSL